MDFSNINDGTSEDPTEFTPQPVIPAQIPPPVVPASISAAESVSEPDTVVATGDPGQFAGFTQRLRGVKLRGANLHGLNLRGVNRRGLTLAGATLAAAIVGGATVAAIDDGGTTTLTPTSDSSSTIPGGTANGQGLTGSPDGSFAGGMGRRGMRGMGGFGNQLGGGYGGQQGGQLGGALPPGFGTDGSAPQFGGTAPSGTTDGTTDSDVGDPTAMSL